MLIQAQVPKLTYILQRTISDRNGSAIKNNNKGSVPRNGTRRQRPAVENNKQGSNAAMQEVGGNMEWQRKAVHGMEE